MRSILAGGVGVVFVAIVAVACGSTDKSRSGYDGESGAGGQGEAGASDAPGGAPSSTEGGAAGSVELASAGAAGSSGADSAGAAGAGSDPGGGGAPGNFVPPRPRLALGGPHSCALKLDGTVACWGRNDHGELGNDEFSTATPPGLAEAVPVAGLQGVVAISSGLYHSCALLDDASVACWGAGYAGQLGDDDFHTNDAGMATPQLVALEGVKQVGAAGDNTCALMLDGTVQCWGDNLFGQLGNDSTARSALPVTVQGLSGVAKIAVGKFQTCSLMDAGTVQCWGYGGVNGGSSINVLTPTPIAGIVEAIDLVAGDSFACALVAGGAVRCWNEGDVGQLGDGMSNDSNTTPVDVTGLTGVVQLSAGARHVCAIDANQAVWCWGDGEFGQLGDGVFHNGFPNFVTEPVAAELLTDVVEVACGADHTCVRTSADEVLCLGLGTHGQLGDGGFYPALPFGSTMPVSALSL